MYFPIFVDLTDKEILVVGGGAVAGRRIRVLRGFCGRITVVAPELSPEIDAVGLNFCRRKFELPDLEDKYMVLAATDDTPLNRRIAELCRERGILVNDASDQRLCDFQFPSVVKDGDVVIGINASGKSHCLVKETRQTIEQCLGVSAAPYDTVHAPTDSDS